jgi:alcohol dehydrogenase YqhD (iron-dependent ADH family)
MTVTTFNECYANHTSSFRHKKDSNKTELSKHIWKLKENNQDYTIKWSIIKTRYFVHRGIKMLQFMFGRKILHFERHKQR